MTIIIIIYQQDTEVICICLAGVLFWEKQFDINTSPCAFAHVVRKAEFM